MTTFLKTHRLLWIPLLLGAGLVLLALVLFPRSPAPATPAVSWTPSSVMETVLAGDSITVPVSFTASKELNDVVGYVVPELQPFIELTPLTLGHISVGETVDFDITISAPADSLPDRVEGVVLLRRGSIATTTYAKPLPVTVVIDWRLFQEPDGLYSLLYPPSFFETFFEGQKLLVLRELDASEGGTEEPGIFLSIDPNPDVLSIEEYYDGEPGTDYFGLSGGEFSEITIDGISAVKFVPFVTLAGDVVVIVPLLDEFIVIDDHGATFQDNDIFAEILNSIEF